MHLVNLHRVLPRLKRLANAKYYSHPAILDQNEYTETPEYPEIVDNSLEGRKFRERNITYEKIKKLNTVEEKQIGLNMPKYYGFKCIILNENKVPFNARPLVQYYTRTHFENIEKLPDCYADSEEFANSIAQEIQPYIENVITIENNCTSRNFTPSLKKPEKQQIEDENTKSIVRQINRIIMNNLADKADHIISAQVDYDPRHEAFWFVGGVNVPKSVVRWRRNFSWFKDRVNENVDRPIQYIGSPLLSIRSNLPLKPVMPYSESENPKFAVPVYEYHPEIVGYFPQRRHGVNIPGYWPGDRDEYGLLSIHGRGHILDRKESFGPEDNINALHCQAMKASFGWLLAQANLLGFTTYNDITYPLTTQTLITNGQLWSIYAYQLNTIEMHGDKLNNPKTNICFGTNPLQLYECIEDGKVKGLNLDVLKMIIQLYLNAPEVRDHEMKPYLGAEEQVVADIEDDNRRIWLENTYKHIASNRPKHLLPPEYYSWESIYKIKHNTRFIEAKRRTFEKGINPYNRRLDEHLPPYIPKVLRPYPKARKKFETTYYPDV